MILVGVLIGVATIGAATSASVGVDRGLIVLLNAAGGREIAQLTANGAVLAAVSDGRGGWFVGGNFTRLGGRRQVALAHLLASGTIDSSWDARISSASGRPVAVQVLARAGSRLFVAGPFARVGGLHRPGLAAVDSNSGRVLRSWLPRPLLWPDIAALTVSGPRLLVARQSSYPTPGVSALDVRTAAVDHRWNPHLLLIGDAGNFNTLLAKGSRVFVAGSFHVAGLHRNGLLALDSRSGRPDRRWAPRVPNCSVCIGFAVVYGLAASPGRIYVSGDFRRIDGVARDGIAALDPRSGAVDRRWRPGRGGNHILHLALAAHRLYAGGSSGLFALTATTGLRLPLPHLHAPRQVLALTVSGPELLVAGRS